MRAMIIDLPKSMYRVLPERKPAPSKLDVTKTMLAVLGVSVLFALGVIL